MIRSTGRHLITPHTTSTRSRMTRTPRKWSNWLARRCCRDSRARSSWAAASQILINHSVLFPIFMGSARFRLRKLVLNRVPLRRLAEEVLRRACLVTIHKIIRLQGTFRNSQMVLRTNQLQICKVLQKRCLWNSDQASISTTAPNSQLLTTPSSITQSYWVTKKTMVRAWIQFYSRQLILAVSSSSSSIYDCRGERRSFRRDLFKSHMDSERARIRRWSRR